MPVKIIFLGNKTQNYTKSDLRLVALNLSKPWRETESFGKPTNRSIYNNYRIVPPLHYYNPETSVMMSEGERLARLRTELGSLLDATCSHIGHVSRAVKRLDNLKIVLYMKRDKARAAIAECMKKLQEQLEELHLVAETELANEIQAREELLRSTKVRLMQHIKATASECTVVEELLEVGNEALLADTGQTELDKMNRLMGENPDRAVVGLTHLEFIPNTSNIMVAFHDPGLFGYLQCTAINPSDITVKIGEEKFPKRLVIGHEEHGVIYTDSPYIENFSRYLEVCLLKPDRSIVPLELADCRDGSYTFSLSSDISGPHAVHVKLYGSAIPSSPMPMFVWDIDDAPPRKEADLPRKDADLPKKDAALPKAKGDEETKIEHKDADSDRKVRVCRNVLSAVSKHIESNGPVREPMFAVLNAEMDCAGPTQASKARNNEATKDDVATNAPQMTKTVVYPKRSFQDEVDQELVPKEIAADDFDKDFMSSDSADQVAEKQAEVRKTRSWIKPDNGSVERGQGDAGNPRRSWATSGKTSAGQDKPSFTASPHKVEAVSRADSCDNWRNPQNNWNLDKQGAGGDAGPSSTRQLWSNTDTSSNNTPPAASKPTGGKISEDKTPICDKLGGKSASPAKAVTFGERPSASPQTISPMNPAVPQNTPNSGFVETRDKFSFDTDSVVKQVSQNLLNCVDSSPGTSSSPATAEKTGTQQASKGYLSEKQFIKDTESSNGLITYLPPTPVAGLTKGLSNMDVNSQKSEDNTQVQSGKSSPVPKPAYAHTALSRSHPARPPSPAASSVATVTLRSGSKEEVWDLQDGTNRTKVSPDSTNSTKSAPDANNNQAEKSGHEHKAGFGTNQNSGNKTGFGAPSTNQNSGNKTSFGASSTNQSSGNKSSFGAPLTNQSSGNKSGFGAPSTNQSSGNKSGFGAPSTNQSSGNKSGFGAPSTNQSSGNKTGFGAPSTNQSSGNKSGFGASTSDQSSGKKFGFGAPLANQSSGNKTRFGAPSTNQSGDSKSGFGAPSTNQNTAEKLSSAVSSNPGTGTNLDQYLKGDKVLKMSFQSKFGKKGFGSADNLSFPIGVTVTRSRDIIVCDSGNAAVKVFSWDGKHRYTLGKDKHAFARPSAVVANDNEDFFVKDDKQIQAFDKQGTLTAAFGLGKLHKPFGLSLTSTGLLVTLDQNRRDPRVYFFTQSGELVRDCGYQPILQDMKARCRFLTTHRDRLYVVDLGKSEVYITDLYGQLIKSFGCFGDKAGEFREPSGITADRHGNLLVADSKNNRVQLFTRDGDSVGIVRLNQDITRPSDIHLTNDGHLLVVNFLQHCVKVYAITE